MSQESKQPSAQAQIVAALMEEALGVESTSSAHTEVDLDDGDVEMETSEEVSQWLKSAGVREQDIEAMKKQMASYKDKRKHSDTTEEEKKGAAKKVKLPSKPVVSHCTGRWKPIVRQSAAWMDRYQTKGPDGLPDLCALECGAGGDCLFYAISQGYFRWKNPALLEKDVTLMADAWMMEARRWAAAGISPENIDEALRVYKEEWFQDRTWKEKLKRASPWVQWPTHPDTWDPSRWGGTFSYTFPPTVEIPEEWRGKKVTEVLPPIDKAAPYLVLDHPEFKYFPPALVGLNADLPEPEKRAISARAFKAATFQALIRSSGEKFRGDDRTLEWMVRADSPVRQERIGFIVVSDRGVMNCAFYPAHEVMDRYMLLYNLHNYHWQLAGMAIPSSASASEYRMQWLFERGQVPQLIQQLWVEDCIVRVEDVNEMDVHHPMHGEARQKFPIVPQ